MPNSRSTRITLRRQVVGWLVAIQVLLFAFPAAAGPPEETHNHFGSNWPNACHHSEYEYSMCKADNGTHHVEGYQLEAEIEDAVEWAIDTNFDPLWNLSVTYYTSHSNPDVTVKDWEVGYNNLFGYGKCPGDATYGGNASSHTRWCKPQVVVINLTYNTSAHYGTTYRRRWLACHEIGHTLGLRHRSASTCMAPFSYSTNYNTLDSHDNTQLEGSY